MFKHQMCTCPGTGHVFPLTQLHVATFSISLFAEVLYGFSHHRGYTIYKTKLFVSYYSKIFVASVIEEAQVGVLLLYALL